MEFHVKPAKPEYVAEAVRQLAKLKREKIKAIKRDDAMGFDTLFATLDELDSYDQRVSSLIWHLQDVGRGGKLSAAYYRASWRHTLLKWRLALNPIVYRKLLVLERDENLTVEQQRMVQLQLGRERSKGAGLGLGVWGYIYFRLVGYLMMRWEGEFARNISRASKEFQLILRDKDEAAGLPISFLEHPRQNYELVIGKQERLRRGRWLASMMIAFVRL